MFCDICFLLNKKIKSSFLSVLFENKGKLNLYFFKEDIQHSLSLFFFFLPIAVEFNRKQLLFSIFLTGNIITIHWENTDEVLALLVFFFLRLKDSFEKFQYFPSTTIVYPWPSLNILSKNS